MEDKNNSSNLFSGFTPSSTSRSSRAIFLVPHTVAAALNAAREEAEFTAGAKTEPKPVTPPPPAAQTAKPSDLSCIRTGTKNDLADAQSLATRILSKAQTGLDKSTLQFSNDLFMATALTLAYTKEGGTLTDMLYYLGDRWDSELQMLYFFRNAPGFEQKDAGIWRHGFARKIQRISSARAEILVNQSSSHWQAAFMGKWRGKGKVSQKEKPRTGVQVFRSDLLDGAVTRMGDIAIEKKAGGDRILDNARVDEGYRSVPNAKAAGEKLEVAKSSFENLVDPIGSLQVDLVLAGAMMPEDFRVTPILLLGDPGIGKTFLAMQLAEALGVNMDVISAGGAQGGFQVTGSHSSWTGARPGSLFTLLAEGKSAAPVMVIDEVDKIRISQYPLLPVLLDLFEPNTSKRFKDEFFEMQFDASRVIFILTANSLDDVPAPLLSRVEVFNVPRPEPQQRLRIIQSVARQLRLKTKMKIGLGKDSSEELAGRVDIDLRKTTRLVKDAFSLAMVDGKKVANLVIPKATGQRSMGFGS
ncbi:MAG: AAA family ATPase [Sulfuricella sp.]